MIDRDRQRGMLYGLAIGDALGAAVEFQPPGSFPEVTGFRAGGPHRLAAGEWTDDTSMALALADSLADVGWDIDDQARRYVRWWQQGDYSVNGRCFDIGHTTASALIHFQQSGSACGAASRDGRTSGNGCIMRLAPIPIYYAPFFPDRLDQFIDRAVESSLPTHASDQCLSATAYLAIVLAGLVHGLPRETVLAAEWQPAQRLRDVLVVHGEVDEIIRGSFRRKQPPAIRGSGYVVHCLEAALWAFHDAPDFRTTVLRAVNLGDDADTTGAVAGQLAGAFWGESGIPLEWRDTVARKDMIERALGGVAEMIELYTHSEPGGHPVNEDAFAVQLHPKAGDCRLVAVADGQGGSPGGAAAARIACRSCLEAAAACDVETLFVSDTWMELVSRADKAVAKDREAGYTTLIAFAVDGDRLVGASVGDSAAVLLTASMAGVVLTVRQRKNPPVGSGEVFAAPFAVRLTAPWAVVAVTDGVWKYAGWETLQLLKPDRSGKEMVSALRAKAALRSGALQDDFTAVVLRSVVG